MQTKIIGILVLFLLLSCRKEVDFTISTVPTIPVIGCLYTSSKPFAVYVSYTHSAQEKAKWENNAIVYLYENDSLLGQAICQDSGIYRLNYYPKAGKKYKLSTNIEGYKTIWAEDSLPAPQIIGNAYFTNGKSYIQVGGESSPAIDLYANIHDTNLSTNFYEAYLRTTVTYTNPFQVTVGYANNWNTEKINNPILTNEGDLAYYSATNTYGLIFSDALFNGKETEFKLRIFGFEQAIDTLTNQYFFELHAVSHNYYYYKKSWLLHAFNQALNADISGDFFSFVQLGEPIELFTNMQGDKALGIFAGYNVSSKKYYYQK